MATREFLGFELEADAKRCVYPQRYEDEDGKSMWVTLMGLLTKAGKDSGKPVEGYLPEASPPCNVVVDRQQEGAAGEGTKNISNIFEVYPDFRSPVGIT